MMIVNNRKVQVDNSGCGINWLGVEDDSTEGGCRAEVEAWIVAENPPRYAKFVASNGLTYRIGAIIEKMEAPAVAVKSFRVGWDIGANGWVCEVRPYEVWNAFPGLVSEAFGVTVSKDREYTVTMHDGKPHGITSEVR